MNTAKLQHKLTAILFADVVGYSRLTGEDETGTHLLLSDYLDIFTAIIKSHGGSVVNFAGDAILAEFHTVTNALVCAAYVQRELATRNAELDDSKKIVFRIGINLGDVIVNRDDIYGDGVNVAARLESLAEPAGICVSESVHTAIGSKLPFDFEYLGERQVKNIAEPVKAYHASQKPGTDLPAPMAAPTAVNSTNSRRFEAIAITIFTVVLVAGGIAWWQFSLPDINPASIERMKLPLPDKPSVAVLPFTNHSNDPEQGFLADGITEDVITNLARLPGLFVVARNSTFTYKDKAVDVRTVAEDLGVRHVVEGSVRQSDDKVRVTAQLIDAVSGHHIWADRYDRNVNDIFSVLDEISTAVAAKLNTELMWTDSGQRSTKNLDAYNLVRRANVEFMKINRDANNRARQLAQRAVEIDPTYARAYSILAYTYAWDVRWGWTSDRKTSGKRAFELANQAVAIDDGDFHAHQALGAVLHGMQQYDRSIAQYEKAISLNPNNADLIAASSNPLLYAGRFDEAIARISTAMRLNPYYRWFYPSFLGRAYYAQGQFKQALPLFEEAIKIDPKNSVAIRYVVAIHGQLGNKIEAATSIAQLKKQIPSASVSVLAEQLGSKAVETPIYLEGLRKAGLQES